MKSLTVATAAALVIGCQAPSALELPGPSRETLPAPASPGGPAPAGSPHTHPKPERIARSYVIHVTPDGTTLAATDPVKHSGDSELESDVAVTKIASGTGSECPTGYQDATSHCITLAMTQDLSRSINGAFLQVTSIEGPEGNTLGSSDAYVQNTDEGTGEADQDQTLGFWVYTADGAASGVLGESPNNEAERTLIVSNPSGASFDVNVTAYATLSYGSYALTDELDEEVSFIDACSGGTSLGQPTSSSLTLPFAFTAWSTSTTSATVSEYGVLSLDSAGAPSSGTPVALPDPSAPTPAFFPFWDDLTYAMDSEICYETVGSAPARQYVVTWKHMSLPGDDGPADLTFSTVLYEGSDVARFMYSSVSGPTSRASGAAASIGTQDESGENGVTTDSDFSLSDGAIWTLIPGS